MVLCRSLSKGLLIRRGSRCRDGGMEGLRDCIGLFLLRGDGVSVHGVVIFPQELPGEFQYELAVRCAGFYDF